jgi:ribosomal protein S18 acetylase RimI-like enzyme
MAEKKQVAIEVSHALSLRSATQQDLGFLRAWKNDQRQFFFHQDPISIEQQQQWFDNFKQRPYDHLLMVEVNAKAMGCMGIRLLDSEWDIYNVILGDAAYGKQGHMTRAFAAMLRMALQQNDTHITLKVLKHNPAHGWYLKNGFVTTFEAEDYYGLRYQTATQKDTET